MIYVLRTWKTKPGTWREFQQLSNEGVWPAMEAAGAKIIGLWTTIIGDANEVVLVTRYDDLDMWQRTRFIEPAPEGVDEEIWKKGREAAIKRQTLTESTHARVMTASEFRAP
jgi:hypothetical protein